MHEGIFRACSQSSCCLERGQNVAALPQRCQGKGRRRTLPESVPRSCHLSPFACRRLDSTLKKIITFPNPLWCSGASTSSSSRRRS